MILKSLPSGSLAGIAAFCAAVLCALAPAPARAQARESVYTVSGVRVDATAQSSSAAQTEAFAQGHRLAFERLVQRITLPEELSRVGMPRVEQAQLERLVASFDVADERRSGTRYLGRMTLRFQETNVQTLLRGAGFTVVDQRAPPVLVVPLVTDVTPDALEAWRTVWEQGGYDAELAPLFAAPRTLTGAPDWAAAARSAQAIGASRALYLDLRMVGGTATVSAVEVGPGGERRDRGSVQGRVSADALVAGLQPLADQISARVQNEWKSRVAASASGERARVSATVLYENLAEWQRIKGGLEQAAATVISEIRIEAVAQQGALVSFSFVGDRQQLATELRRHGISVEETPQGPILRTLRR